MSQSSYQKKTASIIASVFIGFIILSFAFSGYYTKSMYMGPDTVADVSGVPVKMFEYKQILTQKMEMMKKMLRVSDLTTQQLDQFKIRESVIEELINQKLLIVLADKMSVSPTDQEVANEIQSQPYFKTMGQFDFGLYKALLQQNGFTPADYELNIKESIKGRLTYSALNGIPISNKYAEERLKIRNNTIKISAVLIKKDALEQFIDVPEAKLKKFQENPSNQKRLEEYFLKRKPELNKEEEVEARHILIRITKDKKEDVAKKEIEEIAKTVTVKNFTKIADQKSEDPYGKGKGGQLGRFGKGRMVPEFDNAVFSLKPGTISAPVKTNYGYHLILVEKKQEAKEATLAEFKNLLIKEMIQKESRDDLHKIADTLTNNLKNALSAGKTSDVSKLQNEYKFTYEEGKDLNELENAVGSIDLSNDDLAKVFALAAGQKNTFVFTDANFIKIVHADKSKSVASTTSASATNANVTDIGKEKENEQRVISDEFKVGILKHVRDNSKIVVHKKLL